MNNRYILFVRNNLERVRGSISFLLFFGKCSQTEIATRTKRFKAYLSFRMRQTGVCEPRDNKITRPRNFFEVASLAVVGIIPRILDPPRHPAALAVGYFLFLQGLYTLQK